MDKAIWYSGGILLVGVGIYIASCQAERERQDVRREKIVNAVNDSIRTLRDDSVRIAVVRDSISSELKRSLESQNALNDSLKKARGSLVVIATKVNQAQVALEDAKTAADSLLRYPKLVTALFVQRDSLLGVLNLAIRDINKKDNDYHILERLQKADSVRADNAEKRAAALHKINISVQEQLLAERSKWKLRLKVSAPISALAGAAIVCAFKC